MNPKLEPDPSTQSNLFAKRLSSALAERGLPLARVQAKLQKLGHPISVASLSTGPPDGLCPPDPARTASCARWRAS